GHAKRDVAGVDKVQGLARVALVEDHLSTAKSAAACRHQHLTPVTFAESCQQRELHTASSSPVAAPVRRTAPADRLTVVGTVDPTVRANRPGRRAEGGPLRGISRSARFRVVLPVWDTTLPTVISCLGTSM